MTGTLRSGLRRLLVVEDDDDTANLLKVYFSGQDYEVRVARTAAEVDRERERALAYVGGRWEVDPTYQGLALVTVQPNGKLEGDPQLVELKGGVLRLILDKPDGVTLADLQREQGRWAAGLAQRGGEGPSLLGRSRTVRPSAEQRLLDAKEPKDARKLRKLRR